MKREQQGKKLESLKTSLHRITSWSFVQNIKELKESMYIRLILENDYTYKCKLKFYWANIPTVHAFRNRYVLNI